VGGWLLALLLAASAACLPESYSWDNPLDPAAAGQDHDEDGVPNGADNCPWVPNPDQRDVDRDGIGDRCEEGAEGEGAEGEGAEGEGAEGEGAEGEGAEGEGAEGEGEGAEGEGEGAEGEGEGAEGEGEGEPDCAADPYERNDLPAEATPLPGMRVEGLSLCREDEDWFRLALGRTDTVELTVEGRGLEVFLRAPDGVADMAVSTPTATGARAFREEIPSAGSYLILVRGSVTPRYTLEVSVNEAGEGEGEGECEPGAEESRPCGACGTQRWRCDAPGVWTPQGSCSEGICPVSCETDADCVEARCLDEVCEPRAACAADALAGARTSCQESCAGESLSCVQILQGMPPILPETRTCLETYSCTASADGYLPCCRPGEYCGTGIDLFGMTPSWNACCKPGETLADGYLLPLTCEPGPGVYFCGQDADCPAAWGLRRCVHHEEHGRRVCVQCTRGADCGEEGHCLDNACVECTTDDHCPPAQARCLDNLCVQCAGDGDCQDAAKPKCVDHVCVAA
jgi:hypothetical protein